jgi:hypothetical protein
LQGSNNISFIGGSPSTSSQHSITSIHASSSNYSPGGEWTGDGYGERFSRLEDFDQDEEVQPIENSKFNPVMTVDVLQKWPQSENLVFRISITNQNLIFRFHSGKLISKIRDQQRKLLKMERSLEVNPRTANVMLALDDITDRIKSKLNLF